MKKVILIGDSIRMGYQPFVQKKLEGQMEVWGPKENCGHSFRALQHFAQWVESQKPDLVHFNFGIHDACPMKDGKTQIILEQYKLCLERFYEKIKSINAKMIWATITPLFSRSKEYPMTEWKKRPDPIDEYNAAALEIVRKHKIPVNDLHNVIMDNNYLKCLSLDGCHMDEFGNEVLADAVVNAIKKELG